MLWLPACSALSIYSPTSDALIAEQYKSEGKHIEAIAAYRRHLAKRLISKTESENPYFYLLLIGDCYLEIDKIEQARKSYDLAVTQNIDKSLVAERYRRIARWFEDQGQLQKAIAELTRYRQLDTLLFDLEIDRLHKKFVAKEIAEKKSNSTDTKNQPPDSESEPEEASDK